VVFGAGAIIGVASTMENEGIKEFAKKKEYKEWYFVYDKAIDGATPNGGGLITGPYTGKVFTAGNAVGTPAGQISSPASPNGSFGQPITPNMNTGFQAPTK
jgi:hypothetical protein